MNVAASMTQKKKQKSAAKKIKFIMEKIHITIEDNLQDIVDDTKKKVKDDFIDYLKENKNISNFDEYYQNKGCDDIHDICDSNTPIYHSDINGLYYLYGDEFNEAYNNAGIGDGKEDNHHAVAIYCYLEEKAFDYQRELEEQFDNRDKTQDIDAFIKSLEEEN